MNPERIKKLLQQKESIRAKSTKTVTMTGNTSRPT